MSKIKSGRYLHYKGKQYQVIGVARHSETQEEMVVYHPLYGDQALWVRPAKMFNESVIVDGEEIARFEFIGNNISDQLVL